MFYYAGFVQGSYYRLKDQGSYQCIVYNWNSRNVHIVNYSKMQVTVQVNCNFSQCDISIKSEVFYLSVERLAFVWTNCSVILKPIFQLKIFTSIHQIIHFDVYLCQ